jgi:Rrf2 family protein
MRLSGACGYALRAMAYLARHEGGGSVVSHAIAWAEGVSGDFPLKVLTTPATADVLRSGLGRGGGFCPARPAGDITVLKVVEALDGPHRGEAPRVVAADGYRLDGRLQRVCERAAGLVRRWLRQVTVADLAGDGKR